MSQHTNNARPEDGNNVGEGIELWLAGVLHWGILLAAVAIAVAGALYLARHGNDAPQYHQFHGEPRALLSVSGILRNAAQGQTLGLLMAGLLLLIATPIARVVGALLAFAVRRDLMYAIISSTVLAGLLLGLLAS